MQSKASYGWGRGVHRAAGGDPAAQSPAWLPPKAVGRAAPRGGEREPTGGPHHCLQHPADTSYETVLSRVLKPGRTLWSLVKAKEPLEKKPPVESIFKGTRKSAHSVVLSAPLPGGGHTALPLPLLSLHTQAHSLSPRLEDQQLLQDTGASL